jgi:hypothetical protein
MSIRCRTGILAALALAVLGLAPSFADDPKPVKVSSAADARDDHEAMERLIGQVELRLRQIDRWLGDAGAGDTSALAKAGPSGIDELLKRSKDDARQVVTDIDRILELADHVHSGGT